MTFENLEYVEEVLEDWKKEQSYPLLRYEGHNGEKIKIMVQTLRRAIKEAEQRGAKQ